MQIRYSIWNNEHAWASCLLLLAIILVMNICSSIRSNLRGAAAELSACREGATPIEEDVECAP
jgi:hypothetical protein